jgi:hypothetical protein
MMGIIEEVMMAHYEHKLKIYDNYIMSSLGTRFMIIGYFDREGEECSKEEAYFAKAYAKEEGFLNVVLGFYPEIVLNS